ncbi:MAG TPA: hypothetical protein VH396_02215 [Chitinophagaceae bacterium]
MKKLLLLICYMLFSISLIFAQNDSAKFDVILKVNGDEMVGKVTEMGDDFIKFVYKGEALSYTVKKQDILKITYASGRVEVISKAGLPADSAGTGQNSINNSTAESRRNKAAVLPFIFLIDQQSGADEMSFRIQSECYKVFSGKAATLQFQDPNTTNALLIRANITKDNYRAYTMDQVCSILGVQYIVQGTVTVNHGSLNATNSGNSKTSSSGTADSKGNSKSKTDTYSSTTVSQNYKTTVTMNIFDDTGKNIYGKDRESFWQTDDAYKITIQTLAKKAPIYAK